MPDSGDGPYGSLPGATGGVMHGQRRLVGPGLVGVGDARPGAGGTIAEAPRVRERPESTGRGGDESHAQPGRAGHRVGRGNDAQRRIHLDG